MQVISSLEELAEERLHWQQDGSCGFVPTMGYLHPGHMSLVQQARIENRSVAVSIFVNPTQFGPHEDLSRYPRDLPRDLALLAAAGVDVVFTPAAATVYPDGFVTYVGPTGPLAERLEGASRPGHFQGVATVVLKLFNMVRPARAYFGQKDAQQAAVIRHMIDDLNLPVELHVMPTIRESDGLAMSSRNSYLSSVDRTAATVLHRALVAGMNTFIAHPEEGGAAVRSAMAAVVHAEPRSTLDYVDCCHPDTFIPIEAPVELCAPALLCLAVRFGTTRLIDNFQLDKDGVWSTGAPVK
jgi:pantoate--beta-alanine ligase